MVVHDLDIFSTRLGPPETDAVSIVHADTVLTGDGCFQRFEPVSGWKTQVLQPPGDLELTKLAARNELVSVDVYVDYRFRNNA